MAHAPYSRGSGGGRPYTEPARPSMPTPRPVTYFASAEKKEMNPDLLKEAERLAQEIGNVHPSQIRRFYGDVTAFKRRLALDSSLSDAAVQAQMGLLKARAAYAQARRNISEPLLRFFVDHAAAVKDRRDFEAFQRVFETVIAFHKFYEVKERGN